jgi:hypothetical protein
MSLLDLLAVAVAVAGVVVIVVVVAVVVLSILPGWVIKREDAGERVRQPLGVAVCLRDDLSHDSVVKWSLANVRERRHCTTRYRPHTNIKLQINSTYKDLPRAKRSPRLRMPSR